MILKTNRPFISTAFCNFFWLCNSLDATKTSKGMNVHSVGHWRKERLQRHPWQIYRRPLAILQGYVSQTTPRSSMKWIWGRPTCPWKIAASKWLNLVHNKMRECEPSLLTLLKGALLKNQSSCVFELLASEVELVVYWPNARSLPLVTYPLPNLSLNCTQLGLHCNS